MTEQSGNENVFAQLRKASEHISKGFQIIVNLAPDIALYNVLVDSQNDPFLKNLISTPDGISLEDDDIKFAVYAKELYVQGKIDIVQCLIDRNVEKVLAELNDSKQPPRSFPSTSCVPNNLSNEDNARTPDNKPLSPAIDKPLETDDNDDSYLKKGDTTDSTANAGSITSFHLTAVDEKKEDDFVNKDDTVGMDDDNVSEEYTKIAKLSTPVEGGGEYIYHNDSIHKRNRNFEVFKEDNPPRLPVLHPPELIAKVFTHQSVLNYLNIPEESKVNSHNERLEFLGDAYLQFVVSMIIYEKFPHFNEGQMSILRSSIVSNSRLLKFSQIYGFDKQLKKNFNDSSILTGNNKIYADVFEAYLGAIAEQYMMESKDGETNVNDFIKGWFEAKNWLEALCEEQLQTFDPSIVFKMQYSKSSKQDLRLLLGKLNTPDYVRCNIGNRRILSCVKISKKVYGYGVGTSNKEADSRAATDAMCNPGICKICPEVLWKKFEDGVGLDESGGLNFEQYPTKVSQKELEVLRREIAIKYKVGDIKLLVSKNNPYSLLIDDNERNTVKQEINEMHSIDNTNGEIGEASLDHETESDKITEKEKKKEKRSPSSKHKNYGKEYTMGRGGIFGEEYKRIAKGSSKHRAGIHRNANYLIMDEGEGGNGSQSITRELMCHEVLVKCGDIEMDSKNRMNAVFAKRGGVPGYITYRTVDDEFLCELWFSDRQIVSYGLDRNKKNASQKAAMLALKREEYYGGMSDDEDGDDDNENGGEQHRRQVEEEHENKAEKKRPSNRSRGSDDGNSADDESDDEEEQEMERERGRRRRRRRYYKDTSSWSSSCQSSPPLRPSSLSSSLSSLLSSLSSSE
ncbi:hypothetical protein PMKS-002672 [Pichia membranifaciens]|uniref:RNase III domain-containing protein n=1 Tax=Pichia membranifaciens TaxID=4926 RepID=A0A1Q2YI18_9ASCO|nr:hypothetical protein PMKS-002672 [Pichia membranifaciens]